MTAILANVWCCMSRKETPPQLTKEELIKRYLDQSDDFALELDIYRRLQALGFTCSHTGTYEDPVTNLPRQYDIRGEEPHPHTGNICIKVAIECKAIRNLLLIHYTERPQNERYINVIFPPGDGNDLWQGVKGLFYTNQTVGKSFTQLVQKLVQNEWNVSGKDEEVYIKWAQSISSCKDLTTLAVNNNFNHRHINLPVLVIPRDMLWSVDFSDESKAFKPIQHCEYYIGKSFDHYSRKNGKRLLTSEVSHMHIITEDYLEDFINGVRHRLDYIDYLP